MKSVADLNFNFVRSDFDSYVEKGKKLFNINPIAFAHIVLKKNIKKDYSNFKKNVEDMISPVAKVVVCLFFTFEIVF